MSRSRILAAILVAGWTVILVLPAHSQIASYVDEHGKLVYVNGDSPVHRRGSTISPRPTTALGSSTSSKGPLATPPDRLERIVRESAERHKVDPALVKAVISTESSWNPMAVSRKGAVGLMQVVPGTAQRFGVGNPWDPVQNVEAGTMYLKSLLDRYNGNLTKSLAAYNAGERAVDRSDGVPPYYETRQYVQKVTDAYFRPGSGRDPSLWSPPRALVRREVEPNGRVVYTNE